MSDNFFDFIHVRSYVDAYNRRGLSLNALRIRTGLRSISDIFEAYGHDLADDEIERMEKAMTGQDHEREELERLAYEMYPDFLHEEPGYLPQIIEKLREKRLETMQKIGRGLIKKH